MMNSSTKSSLSAPRARLIECMQRLHFGTIEGLIVLDGEPLFNPPPRLVRGVKFRGENDPRPELNLDDFALKAEVRDLFKNFDSLGNGTIRRLKVQYGLPVSMEVEEVVA